ncbi:Ppx/GppA phosphatase family protein [Mobiluncus mulieris]|uniref:Phosphatase n=1 Tax=Mobiluncus mulieris TaxID=2052 RepID=A0ABD4TXZ2_9ACTO|nr:phosphatase [Mobiluncus mulieris]MCU9969756.1 phosphatase [Mobiluncus mulieris]MCU9974162.1 phosphatase [Mobiluncus mulieris]MCV0010286.1 phosphatase [Mobiluncus mulieris]NMX20396.1 phosphatase [Mobiluncus mulieris]
MRLAAIDCGTHSIRLLISDFDPTHPEVFPREVLRKTQIVGLGAGVDKTGHLAPEALNRTFTAVEDYAARIRQAEVDRVRMVATSASRDADNFFEFATGVEARLGVSPEVISGREEATLGFSGAVALHPGVASPALVVDIGGGSTEFSFGLTSGVHVADSLGASPDTEDSPGSGLAKTELRAAISMNMGSTRVTERYLRPAEDSRGIPSADAVAQASEFIDALIAEAAETVPLSQARTLIGVAGSVTTLTALGLGLETYDRFRINGAVLSSAKHRELARELVGMPRAKKAALGPMHPKRVNQIAGGVLVWERILAYLEGQPGPDSGAAPRGSFPVCTSENDILDGLMFALAGTASASAGGAVERGAQRD